MAGTHQKLLYHIVFSTKNRKPYLSDGHRDEVFAYMAGVAKNLDGFALEVGGWVDHAHLLVRIPAKIAVSDFVGRIKSSTSKHINDTDGEILKFGWQDGFGAFSVSASKKDRVADYIRNQVAHHRHVTFENEYVKLLEKHEIQYDSQYLWD